MTDIVQAPNPADFSRDDRPRDYTAYVTVRGTISINIQADSADDAKRQAEAEVEKMEAERYVEIDDIDAIELDRVTKDRPMFRVTRDGKTMQVSHLDPGDVPRAPGECGF
jgi:hypothetical protein